MRRRIAERRAGVEVFADRSCELAGRTRRRFGKRNLAGVAAAGPETPEFRQWAIDITIQNNIGRFFAAKFRAGVLYAIYTRSADPAALEGALKSYGTARTAWKTIADTANNVYRPDLTFGYTPQLRGSWFDRLPAIDQDIVAMATTKLAMPHNK